MYVNLKNSYKSKKLKNSQNSQNEVHVKTFLINIYFRNFKNQESFLFSQFFADNSNKKHFVRPPFSPLIVSNDPRDPSWLCPNTIGDEGFP